MSTHRPSTAPAGLIFGFSCLLLSAGCASGENEGGSDSETETGGSTGDGDGDGTVTGDGDGDSMGEGDGDGDDGGCGGVGCECSNDDGCDPGLVCTDQMCQITVCGDDLVEGDEQCEDGNEIDGDGCDSDCTLTGIAQVAAGEQHTCVIIDGGAVRCWGRGEFGQLGRGNPQNIGDDEFPSDLGDLPLPTGAVSLGLGGQHSCAIFDDGALRCWGLNDRGQLGYGNVLNLGDDETLEALAAVSVPPVIEVAVGLRHTCVRAGVGEVRCWGRNNQGQLGYGNTLAMVPVLELLLPGGALSVGGEATRLAIGGDHSCVSFIDGGTRCWGRNNLGQLGLGNIDNVGDNELPSSVSLVGVVPPALPANTEISELALGLSHSCALLSNGDVRCWGSNAFGQLGLGHIDDIGDDELPASAAAVELGAAAVQVVAGAAHSCALLKDGGVVCWGDASVGQLGYGNLDNMGDDEPADTGGLVDLGGPAIQLAAGTNHTCAILEGATELVCWGQNNQNQLGLGSSVTVGDNETPADAGLVSVF